MPVTSPFRSLCPVDASVRGAPWAESGSGRGEPTFERSSWLPLELTRSEPPQIPVRRGLEVQLREAHFDDASGLAALRADGASTLARDWILRHATHHRPLWVAEFNDAVVGWLSLLGLGDRPGCRHSAEVDLHVGGPWRGRGVGGKLLRHALDRAPAIGIDRLIAHVRNDDQPTKSLLLEQSFKVWGTLPDVLWENARSLDVVIFGRAVSAVTVS